MKKVYFLALFLSLSKAHSDYSPPGSTTFACGPHKYIVESPAFVCDISSDCPDSSREFSYWVLKGKKRIKLKDLEFPDFKSSKAVELIYEKQRVFAHGSLIYLDKEEKQPCKEIDSNALKGQF